MQILGITMWWRDHISALVDDLLASVCSDLQRGLGQSAAQSQELGMIISISKPEEGGVLIPVQGWVTALSISHKWEESGAGDWQTLCSYTDPVKVYYRKEIAKRERKAVDLPSIYLPTLSYGHVICEVTKRITSQSQAREMRFVWDSVVALSLRDKVRSSVTQKKLSVEPPWHWKESWFGNVLPKEGPRADLAWECVPKDELERESLLRQSQTRLISVGS